jgi:rare lipoprotein A
MYAMTAAHKTLPIPVYVRVTNLENGRSVVVRVNDRGPFVGDRIIDLSYTAAHKLDMTRKGTALVEIRVIEPGDDSPPPSVPLPMATATAANAPVPPVPAAIAGPSAAIGVSSRFLQTGSFSARANAEAMQRRLADSGIRNTLVREALVGDRMVFRVQVGPLDGALEADDMIERLRIAGVPDARPAHE